LWVAFANLTGIFKGFEILFIAEIQQNQLNFLPLYVVVSEIPEFLKMIVDSVTKSQPVGFPGE